MRHHDDPGPMIVGHPAKQLHHLAASMTVQGRRGLVGQDDAGLVGQGSGDGHALLLATGELRRRVVGPIGNPQLLKKGDCPPTSLPRRRTVQFQCDLDILVYAEERDQVRLLEDETDVFVAEGPQVGQGRRTIHDHLSANEDLTRGRRIEPGIERAVQYMTRCPFSLSRLVKVTKTGQAVYKAEKDACRAFPDPPQGDVIEKILRHCGLWHPSAPRAPPAGDGSIHDPDGSSDRQTASSDEPRELTYVDIDTFLATF